MEVKELQQSLKTYLMEKDKLKRLEKAVHSIVKENSDRRFHLDLSEVVPARAQQEQGEEAAPVYMMYGMMGWGPVSASAPQRARKRDTGLEKILGVALSDTDALDVLIVLLRRQTTLVEQLEEELRKIGVKV